MARGDLATAAAASRGKVPPPRAAVPRQTGSTPVTIRTKSAESPGGDFRAGTIDKIDTSIKLKPVAVVKSFSSRLIPPTDIIGCKML
jgi:hypothetical protein